MNWVNVRSSNNCCCTLASPLPLLVSSSLPLSLSLCSIMPRDLAAFLASHLAWKWDISQEFKSDMESALAWVCTRARDWQVTARQAVPLSPTPPRSLSLPLSHSRCIWRNLSGETCFAIDAAYYMQIRSTQSRTNRSEWLRLGARRTDLARPGIDPALPVLPIKNKCQARGGHSHMMFLLAYPVRDWPELPVEESFFRGCSHSALCFACISVSSKDIVMKFELI